MARDNWSGRFGFVLAAAGSAIGLGNLWKFPYITWNNNGGAFVLVYLLCILVVGLPLMCSEILIGRRSQSSVASAFGRLGHPKWDFVGFIGVAAGFVILGFYAVIAGWSLASFAECLGWSVQGYEAPSDEAFGTFLADPLKQIGLGFVFMVATSLIVWRGVSGGIERAAKILMPTLMVILVYILIVTCTLSGAGEALTFLFKPDFSKLDSHGVLEALGHAFFTLSLGMGAMITYGSYMKKSERVVPISITVVILDTIIALVACMIMYSIIFTVDGLRDEVGKSTVGMLFVTLPKLFYTEMTGSGGAFVGPLFYILVAFAALSSTISLLEVIVSLFVDRYGWNRTKATVTAATSVFGLSVLSALSLGANGFLSSVKLFGSSETGVLHSLNKLVTKDKGGVLNILDHISANWLLPIGGLAITIYVGWVLPTKDSKEELFGEGEGSSLFYKVWLFFVRFVVPAAIGWVIVDVVLGGDFS